jgi:hypothetical protein
MHLRALRLGNTLSPWCCEHMTVRARKRCAGSHLPLARPPTSGGWCDTSPAGRARLRVACPQGRQGPKALPALDPCHMHLSAAYQPHMGERIGWVELRSMDRNGARYASSPSLTRGPPNMQGRDRCLLARWCSNCCYTAAKARSGGLILLGSLPSFSQPVAASLAAILLTGTLRNEHDSAPSAGIDGDLVYE